MVNHMNYANNTVTDIKIAYIGGGSRGWAWGLMSDLAACDDISGNVFLYDIDFDAAKNNEIIGNKYNQAEGAKSTWHYKAVETIDEALSAPNFLLCYMEYTISCGIQQRSILVNGEKQESLSYL